MVSIWPILLDPPTWRSAPSNAVNLRRFVICACWRGPPMLSSRQSSRLQIQKFGFDSRRYQMFWEVVGLKQGPLSLVSTTEELLERESSCSSLESENTAVGPCWLCNTPLSAKVGANLADKLRSLIMHISLSDSGHGISFCILKEVKPTPETCHFNQYQPVDNTQNIRKFQSRNFRQSDDGKTWGCYSGLCGWSWVSSGYAFRKLALFSS
jgi:hypothetical protein